MWCPPPPLLDIWPLHFLPNVLHDDDDDDDNVDDDVDDDVNDDARWTT